VQENYVRIFLEMSKNSISNSRKEDPEEVTAMVVVEAVVTTAMGDMGTKITVGATTIDLVVVTITAMGDTTTELLVAMETQTHLTLVVNKQLLL